MSSLVQEIAKQTGLKPTQVNGALVAKNAAWLVKDWTSRWQEPSCNGQLVKRVVTSSATWLEVFYPQPRSQQTELAYKYACDTWKTWKDVFHAGMQQQPSAEDVSAFAASCKQFVMKYLLAYTSHKFPFYMHLILTHAGSYMRYYSSTGKFRHVLTHPTYR